MDPAGGITRNQGLSIVTDGHLDWDGCCNLERPQLSAGDIPEASVAVATAGEQVAIRSESRPQHTIGQFAKHTTDLYNGLWTGKFVGTHLSALLADIRENREFLARLEDMEKDLKQARARVTGGSAYKTLTVSVQSDFPAQSEIDEAISMFTEQIKKSKDKPKSGERMSRDPIVAREGMLEELSDSTLWDDLRSICEEKSRCGTVWMVFTKRGLEIINDPRGKGEPLTFSDENWSSGTTRSKGGTNSKYVSNSNSFDTRVLEKEIKKVRSRINEQTPLVSGNRELLTTRILDSPDSLTVLENGAQCPSKTYMKIANEGLQRGFFLWVVGLDTRKRPHRWCERCVTEAFKEMQAEWGLNMEILAPLEFTDGGAHCMSDRCAGKEVNIIDQHEVLKIGFRDRRSAS